MHTMWKGTISFGLVNIPIKMFTATEDKDIKFRYLHKECNTPIKYKKKCETCDREISEDEIVKGYEYRPGQFIILNDEDFETIQTEANNKSIDILDFVNLVDIDPIYFDKSYYLSPQDTIGKAYNLLLTAMNNTNKIAIAKITIRNKQKLATIRVYNNVLVLETIFYPDEVRSTSLIPGMPLNKDVDTKELDIATKLIDNLSTDFDPNKYTDDYRNALQELIESKVNGKEIEIAPQAPKSNVLDLMEALQASLKETKGKTVSTKKRKTTKTSKANL